MAKQCSHVQCSSTVASSRCTVITTTVNSSVPTCTTRRHASTASSVGRAAANVTRTDSGHGAEGNTSHSACMVCCYACTYKVLLCEHAMLLFSL